MKKALRPGVMLRNVAVLVLSLIWLAPTYLILVNAMQPVADAGNGPAWFPTGFAFFENVAAVWESSPFAESMLNSLIYAVAGAGLAVLFATISAFGVVVMPVKNPKLWFWLIYSGTLLPLQVFAFPLYRAAATEGIDLYDTKWILIIVYTALCIPFAFFVTRNFMVTLPPEVAQAAKLDGAGWWRMLFSIYLPLVRPAMVAGFVFQFIFIWNELFFGISLTISPENSPVMASVAALSGQGAVAQTPEIMAVSLVASLPAVAMFLIFQRYFTTGLTSNLG